MVRGGERVGWEPQLQGGACGALLAALGVVTMFQCGMYENDAALWRTTLARNPEAWIAHTSLGEQVPKVRASRVVDGAGAAGTVIEAGSRVVAARGSGALELIEVQLPGKRAASGPDPANPGRIPLAQPLD